MNIKLLFSKQTELSEAFSSTQKAVITASLMVCVMWPRWVKSFFNTNTVL